MNPMMDRIMAGESICRSEINLFNANSIMEWVRNTESHHSPDNCTKKDCIHAPRPMDVEWAATLVNEAGVVCTCGEHGIDDWDEAARIIKEFRGRW